MPELKEYLTRWKDDYDFRTMVNATGSVLVTAIFALYNGFLGISHASAWHGGICIYYMLLILIRGIVIFSEYSNARRGGIKAAEDRKRTFVSASALLLVMNLSLVAPFAMMVKQERPVSMTLVPAIAMAAYTVYKVTIAAMNLGTKNRSNNPLVWLLRRTNFMDALVSIATLQNTLIMVNTAGNKMTMLPLTAISSGLIWTVIVSLSILNLVQTLKRPEN